MLRRERSTIHSSQVVETTMLTAAQLVPCDSPGLLSEVLHPHHMTKQYKHAMHATEAFFTPFWPRTWHPRDTGSCYRVRPQRAFRKRYQLGTCQAVRRVCCHIFWVRHTRPHVWVASANQHSDCPQSDSITQTV